MCGKDSECWWSTKERVWCLLLLGEGDDMLNMASEIHSSPRADSPITESSLMSVVCQPSAIAVASV